MAEKQHIKIDGEQVALSNLDKVLYPDADFTKADVIDYYRRIASVILPHLKDRPISRKRFPNGVDESFFFEKNCPDWRPDYVETAEVKSRRSRNKSTQYCLIDDAASLVWLANLAALELHPLLATVDDLERPTCMVFDLDPGEPAGVMDCREIALHLRELFADLDLDCYVKTSGGKGLHLYVPLNTKIDFDATKSFAHAIARIIEKDQPARVISKMSKAERKGKVFIDWSQNSRHKTTVAPYSLRGRARPTVSTPITWDELDAASKADDLTFEADDVLERMDEIDDPFAPVLKQEQKLPNLG